MQPTAQRLLLGLLCSAWSCSGFTEESNALNFVQRKVLPRVAPAPNNSTAQSELLSQPWLLHHKYIFACHHKAGVYLLDTLFKMVFYALGAKEGDMGRWIQPCYPFTCLFPEAPLQIWIDLYSAERAQEAREAAGAKGIRVVGIVRDPVSMIVSAYCYHHRGMEPYNAMFYPEGTLLQLGPKEGLKFVAERMLALIENMTSAFEQPVNDTFHLVYEKVAGSSQGFDEQVEEMMSFLFEDHLTSEQHSLLLNVTKFADLNRFPRDSSDSSHMNDEECEEEVSKYVPSLHPELLSRYRSFQERLGYAVT
ncbi:unnamed protein product [Symbiodinium natans]|uniref:Sulfotransferase n=1 Tax=Symbiodinium natans TaxID=878477 RepID=A0A812LCF0_9DINO|nr:unnamed protein product [Symbiodinium natans]